LIGSPTNAGYPEKMSVKTKTVVHVHVSIAINKFLLFDAVLKLTSAAALERLIDVEILPSCDPRLSAALPSTSVYFGVNEAVKIAIENAARMPLQTSVCQLQKHSLETVVLEDMAINSSVPGSQEAPAETGVCEKSSSRQKTQSNISSSKRTALGGRGYRSLARDTGALCAAEAVNENLVVAAAALKEELKTSTDGREHGLKRSVAKVHLPRKRKRKVYEDLAGSEDRFPYMKYLMNDEREFSHHLSGLSYYAELDENPDDPMMLISLYEIDDIMAFHHQGFIRDLNTALIGRKLHFTPVHSSPCDRTVSRLGQLSLQTYCDGHFIECGSVSREHMVCLNQWALREPLEKVVRNMWRDGQNVAVSLPYPSVCCMSDVCSWLSCQLHYLMFHMGIKCIDPPDIFIGSSLQPDLITNCLYRMFCHYVDYLCEKLDKYFQEVDYYMASVHAGKHGDGAGETETYANSVLTSATPDEKRGKRLKRSLYSSKKKYPSNLTTKISSSWQTSVEYDYELDKSELLEVADLEPAIPLHEMERFNDHHAEKATGYGHKKDDASTARRKRKLPKAYFDDVDHEKNGDVQPKARRIGRDHTRLLARDRQSDSDVHRKKHDRQRAGQKDAVAAVSSSHNLSSSSLFEDSLDFVLYDEDGNIVVRCSDTGHTVDVESTKDEELQSAVATVPSGLTVVDECYDSNHQWYSVVHDHCYTVAPEHLVQSEGPVVTDLDKEHHRPAVDVKTCDNDNSALSVTSVKLSDAEEDNDANIPLKDVTLADDRTSQLLLDHSVESTVTKIHPSSTLPVVGTAAVSDVDAKSTVKKIHLLPPLSGASIAAGSEVNTKTAATKIHPLSVVSAPTANAEALIKSPEQPVTKKPVGRKKLVRPQKTAEKEGGMDTQKSRDVGENEYSKCHKSATLSETSDSAKVSLNMDSALVSASKEVSSYNDKRPFSTSSETSKMSTGASKICVSLENTQNVSSDIAEVPAKLSEPAKAPDDVGAVSEAHSIFVDRDNKVVNDEVSIEADKSACESVLSAAAVAAAARASSYYKDAYLSEMADAYGVWPSSNFDVAFDPTNVPGGHMYNPFRKTWPVLQHVIDGKTDLLLKVCSFPDAKSFSIRRVMRENGFLWGVCLSLFDPAVIKPNIAESNLYTESDLSAAGKTKSAKSTNPLMQAFRQAVEAKKKVATRSKLTVLKQHSDDAGSQVWSAKRSSGKMSIVFGSAVKSGGSLSLVVAADHASKRESGSNMFRNMVMSSVSNMNSDISDVISQMCGEQCLVKGSQTTEYQSTVPVTSKHLSMLSDLAVDVYDVAEHKLEKVFAAKDAVMMESIKKSVKDNESAVVSKAAAVAITTVATATSQTLISVSSSAIGTISSSTSLPSVNASKTSTAEITAVNVPVSADVKTASAATQVCQSSISQSVVAQSVPSTDVIVTATSGAVISGSASVSASVSAAVSVMVTVVASAVADMRPPPLPPLSLSHVGVGLASQSSSLPANSTSVSQLSTSTPTCTAAYQPTVPEAFSNPPLPLEHLIHRPPPLIQPHLYSMPPAVGIPFNVPPPGFVDTSVPPPPILSYPPPSWYPPSSAAEGYPAYGGTYTAVPVVGCQEVPKAPVSDASVPCNLQTAVTSIQTPANTEQKNVSSVSYSSPVPQRSDVLNNQRPPTTVDKLSQESHSTAATASLAPEFQPRAVRSRGPGVPQQSLVSQASLKPVASSLLQGNRPRGPLKPIIPVTQSAPSRLPGPVVRQVRPVSSTASTEIRPVSSQQNSNIQPRGTVLGTKPTVTAAGFPTVSQSNRVPLRPVTASQPYRPSISSPLLGNTPRAGVRPRPSVSQSSQPTAPGSQPRVTSPLIGQSPHVTVRAGPPINHAVQPRVAVPGSQSRGPVRPMSVRPIHPDSQPAAAVPLIGQSPHTSFRPKTMAPSTLGNQTSHTVVSGAPKRLPAKSQLPSTSVQPGVAVIERPSRPLTAAGGVSAVQSGKGPLLTPNSRVYILNSGSSPVCKDVKVSMLIVLMLL